MSNSFEDEMALIWAGANARHFSDPAEFVKRVADVHAGVSKIGIPINPQCKEPAAHASPRVTKAQAISLLGGSVGTTAQAIGINPQAISQWPDVLPARLVDRVIAACVRTGIAVPDGVLGAKASVEATHG